MREINVNEIINAIERLFIDANYNLSDNVFDALKKAAETEGSPVGKEVIKELITNANLAMEEQIPICQELLLHIIQEGLLNFQEMLKKW